MPGFFMIMNVSLNQAMYHKILYDLYHATRLGESVESVDEE